MITLIAVRSQPAAVARIFERKFTDDQINAGTIEYPQHSTGDA